jgi:hypothetical protein
MIASNVTRVEVNTRPDINERIREETARRIEEYRNSGFQELTYRLAELDGEWDVERVLEMNFAGVVFGSFVFGTLSSRKWLLLPPIAACFMLQHVIKGWCPPLAVLRRLGFRTAAEINRERMALKILRGDFAHLGVPPVQGGLASEGSLLDALED